MLVGEETVTAAVVAKVGVVGGAVAFTDARELGGRKVPAVAKLLAAGVEGRELSK